MIETTVARDAYTSITALVDELVVAGLEHVCICPGSRSTPLALTCARHPELEIWTHIDERSAAFFALGLAKATGSPIALEIGRAHSELQSRGHLVCRRLLENKTIPTADPQPRSEEHTTELQSRGQFVCR